MAGRSIGTRPGFIVGDSMSTAHLKGAITQVPAQKGLTTGHLTQAAGGSSSASGSSRSSSGGQSSSGSTTPKSK